MTWFDDVAALFDGSDYHPICETHGQPHLRLRRKVDAFQHGSMMTFDCERYEHTNGYCVGDDDVSRTIELYAMWEPIETRMFVDAVSEMPGVVIDFGCQIGWYSRLARLLDRPTLAFDAVGEHLDLCSQNAPGVHTVRTWIDDTSPVLPVDGAPPISMVKMDIEGSERHALRMIDPLIDAGLVASILMEVSPVFNDSYPAIVGSLLRRGYTATVVSPFASIEAATIERVLGAFGQADVMFRKA